MPAQVATRHRASRGRTRINPYTRRNRIVALDDDIRELVRSRVAIKTDDPGTRAYFDPWTDGCEYLDDSLFTDIKARLKQKRTKVTPAAFLRAFAQAAETSEQHLRVLALIHDFVRDVEDKGYVTQPTLRRHAGTWLWCVVATDIVTVTCECGCGDYKIRPSCTLVNMGSEINMIPAGIVRLQVPIDYVSYYAIRKS